MNPKHTPYHSDWPEEEKPMSREEIEKIEQEVKQIREAAELQRLRELFQEKAL